AADQRRADAVGVDRDATALERADPLGVEAAGRDDLDALEAVAIERLAHLADKPLVDAAWVEVAHLVPERAVDELARGVEPYAPEPRAQRSGDLESGLDRVVLEVDEDGDVDVGVGVLGELRRGEDRVAAVRRDQRVRDRPDASAAPPRRLRLRRDADLGADHLAGDVRRVAVAGLDTVVIVARRHEDDRLAVR